MVSVDYLIIGGGIAGTTAAETFREKDSSARIAILEREPHMLYSRVLIPRYAQGKIDRNKLWLRKIHDYEKLRISLYQQALVTGCNFIKREVYVVFGGEGGIPLRQGSSEANEETFSYRKLLIASGGVPKPFPIKFPKEFLPLVLRMQTIDDADAIKSALVAASSKDAMVIGEGFIAAEFIEIFFTNGFRTHVVCAGGAFGERRFGNAGARMLEDIYQKHGVRFYKTIKDEDFDKMAGWLVDGRTQINPSLVGVGTGLVRNIDTFKELKCDKGIITNEYLQTNYPDVYAAGDVAEWYNTKTSSHQISGNWNSSFVQGKTAALNMIGQQVEFNVLPTYSIVTFGINITLIGNVYDADGVLESVGNVVHPHLLRVVFKNGKAAGAAIINRFNDKTKLAALIEREAEKHEFESLINL